MQIVRTFTSRWKGHFVDIKCKKCGIEFKDGEKVIYTINGHMHRGQLKHSKCYTDAHGVPIFDV